MLTCAAMQHAAGDDSSYLMSVGSFAKDDLLNTQS